MIDYIAILLKENIKALEFDAVLLNVNVVEGYNGQVIYGDIVEDKKDRFDDYTPIRTSLIQSINEIEPGVQLAKTLNTTYLLVG